MLSFAVPVRHMDIVTKKQLNILIQLAEADKHFAKVEREMVFRIAKQRNFAEGIVNDLIRNPELYRADVHRPESL